MTRAILVTTLVLAGLCLAVAAARPVATAGTAGDEQPRVIIQVNRNLQVRGHVELEDEDIIVVRVPGGSIESYAKTRITRIVRLVEPQPGQRGIVVLRNGEQRRGVLLDDGFDEVVLEIEGIRTRLPREIVDYVVLEPTFEERYAEYKAALKAGQPLLHLELCRWLLSERRYELARDEIEALLAYADIPEARRLLTVVEAQIALLGKGREAPRAEDEPMGPPAALEEQPVLSFEDVNLIRVYEIDFDRPPQVSVSPETIRRMIEGYGTSNLIPIDPPERTALFRADPIDIVRLMFELRARDLYPEVEVLTEPWALNLFRQRVHNTWLIGNCATSRCHGGPEPGRFRLHRDRYRDMRVRYTNLLLLERTEVDPVWPLINYEDPAMSLIIQYGLPRNLARRPHPDVPGWEPVFPSTDARLLRETVEWIVAMMRPRPVYPIDLPGPPDPGSEPGAAPPARDPPGEPPDS